jgi:hypothetical protein
MFLLFLFLESMKNDATYLPNFQWSAGSPQEGAADCVQSLASQGFVICAVAQFWRIFLSGAAELCEKIKRLFVKIEGKTALDRPSRGFLVSGSAVCRQTYGAQSRTGSLQLFLCFPRVGVECPFPEHS